MVTTDKAARTKLIEQIQTEVAKDLATVPLLQGAQVAVVGKNVSGTDETLDASFKFRYAPLPSSHESPSEAGRTCSPAPGRSLPCTTTIGSMTRWSLATTPRPAAAERHDATRGRRPAAATSSSGPC